MKIVRSVLFFGHPINLYGSIEEPLFMALEIAKLIDYSVGNTAHMLEVVEDNEKVLVRTNTTYQRGGNRKPIWFVTEYGLYEILYSSRKPIAQQFKGYVRDLLRDIRLNRDVAPLKERWLQCFTEQEFDERYDILNGDFIDFEEDSDE